MITDGQKEWLSGNLDVDREAEADRNSGGGMTSHLTQVLHGPDWHRTENSGKSMKRATFSSGWTQPGERWEVRAKIIHFGYDRRNSFLTNSVTIKLKQHKWTPAQQIPRQKKSGNVPVQESNPQPSAFKADALTTRLPAPSLLGRSFQQTVKQKAPT